jgi:16S rRNA A1518/A1519 N6-dimethyltransferase RsmA/KsgA/DIM1 with predicted DNA glycosylase/AP lyase activity
MDYKIFASIPFNVTAPIMRKILDGHHPPQAAYLVLQKEAAQKFAGTPRETQASILAKPWFDFQIVRELQRTDFEPIPGVDVVFLQIKKRDPPLITPEEAASYCRFVRYGFGVWKSNLRLIYQPIFSQQQWRRLARELHFAPNATPTQLRFDQWLGLFAGFRRYVPPTKQGMIVARS